MASLIKYSAVAGKIRAMYGNRLREEDFAHLKSLKSVPAAAAFLQSHPAWSLALDGVSPAEIHRGTLERMLRHSLLEEYRRIFCFLTRDDHPLMRYPLLRFETDQILYFLRLLRAGVPQDYRFSPPAFYREQSKIDFSAFSRCTDYPSFLDILRHTSFYPLLAALSTPAEPLPAYETVDIVLHNHFYSSMLSAIDGCYHGVVRKTLEDSVAMQIDMINIIRAVRLRRFFSGPKADVSGYLVPFRFRIPGDFIGKLLAAPDETAVFSLLRSSRYGKVFAENQFDTIEEYYYKALYDFNIRHLREGVPSVYTPVAYLWLKEIELHELITVIECIRYGVPQEKMPAPFVRGRRLPSV